MDVYFNFANPSGNWIQALSAIAAPLAAFIAVAVAAWQGHLQRQYLKQDLFQKRYDLYLGVRNYLSDYAVNAKSNIDDAIRFLRNTKEVEWLFGPELDAFVKEIYSKSNKWRSMQQLQNVGQTVAPVRQTEIDELWEWLAVTAPKLAHQWFTPYLKLYSEPNTPIGRLFRRFKRNRAAPTTPSR